MTDSTVSQPFLSRHFLATKASTVTAVPFPPAGPEDSEGKAIHHNILCMTGWNDDLKEYQLNLCNFCVEKRLGNISGSPEVSLLSTFVCPSGCTSVDIGRKPVKSFQGNGATIVAGSTDGHLYRMKLTLPVVPGSCPSTIRLDAVDFEDEELLVFARPHSGHCSSVAVHETGHVAASVSLDGTICLSNLDGTSRNKASRVHHDSRGTVSYSTCSWAMSGDSVLSTNHQGRADVWDMRDTNSVLHLGCEEYLSNKRIRGSLISSACNPAKSHVCVVGSDVGHFVEWDFRYPKEPTYTEIVDGAIKSIVYESQGSTIERLRFCTENGQIYKMLDGEAHLLYEEPLVGFESMCVLSTGLDSQIFCSTRQEGLIYIHTSSKYY